MKIELKSIDYNKSLSETAYCFAAKMYVDGKYVADVRNRGRGIVNDFDPCKKEDREVLKEAEQFCASELGNPRVKKDDLGAYLNLSEYSDKMVLDYLNRKEDLRVQRDIDRQTKSGLVYGNPKGEYYIIAFEMPIATIISLPRGIDVLKGKIERQVVPHIKKGDRLLNTNIPEQVLKDAGLKPEQYTLPAPIEQKQATARALRKTKGKSV